MTTPPPIDEPPQGRSVRTIVLVMALVLILPTLLFYAVAPDEPLKEDVAVFANGRHRAYFADPPRYRLLGYDRFCIVEADDLLMIVQKASDRPDGSLLARVQGEARPELPFCPPGAEVSIRPHQVRQKDDVLSRIKNRLARLWSP